MPVGDEEDEEDDDDDDDNGISIARRVVSSSQRHNKRTTDYADVVGEDLRCAACGEVLDADIVQSECGHRMDGHCYKQML